MPPSSYKRTASPAFLLVSIRLLHTAVWTLMAGCILTLPVMAFMRRFRWALALTILVVCECAVLALNGGRCPMTDWATRYTEDRAPNFDIYLPAWLAQHNKVIFGTLFVVNELILLWCWLLHP